MFRKKQTAFGLDISDDSLRVAQFKGRGGKLTLISIGEARIPSGIVEDGKIIRKKALADAISGLLPIARPKKILSRNVVCCLPESKVYIHILEVPKMSADKVDEVIKWEIEEYIPLKVQQVYLDWEVISEKDDKFKVLVAASPREIIDAYLKTMKLADLKTMALEMESRALARVLVEKMGKKGAVLLVDMGGRSTNFTVFDGETIQYSATIPTAGRTFTKVIAKKLDISEAEAEKMKRKFGLDGRKKRDKILNVLKDPVKEILNEIKDTIEFYESQNTGKYKIKKIILCGGSANIPKILDYFQSRLKYKVEIADPRKVVASSITRKAGRYFTRNKSISFGTCLGLALRGVMKDPVTREVNLIPQEWQKAYGERSVRKFISVVSTMLVLFGFLVAAFFSGVWFYLHRENNSLLRQIEREEKAFRDKDPNNLREFARDFNSRLSVLSYLQRDKKYWSKLFIELRDVKPSGVQLKDFSTDKKGKKIEVGLEGRAVSRDDILQFKQNLENSEIFENVKLPLSSLGVKENVLFEISFTVSEDKLE
jgi:type IV pilus assembly protein PilM